MVEPASQDLYVMQNEHGCIKIGRSLDPGKRLETLRKSERCDIELVAAFDGGGENEEAIHVELTQFRLVGEWFDGSDQSRKAIQDLFGLAPACWIFAHDPEEAAIWIRHIEVVRAADFVRKEIGKAIYNAPSLAVPDWVHDYIFLRCWYLTQPDKKRWVRLVRNTMEPTKEYSHPVTNEWGAMPPFSTDVAAALSLWPEADRPASWTGSALECCVGAMKAIRARLPKVPRQESTGW